MQRVLADFERKGYSRLTSGKFIFPYSKSHMKLLLLSESKTEVGSPALNTSLLSEAHSSSWGLHGSAVIDSHRPAHSLWGMALLLLPCASISIPSDTRESPARPSRCHTALPCGALACCYPWSTLWVPSWLTPRSSPWSLSLAFVLPCSPVDRGEATQWKISLQQTVGNAGFATFY